jgi:phosphatidylserine decarboxylase
MVCQVAGLLARRIHCPLSLEDNLERGKRFGMIKFGSRVELYLPLDVAHSVKVKLGEKAKAGETILFELEKK